jgi:ribosome-binding protein aMBF1 (putative translation factor)
METWEETEARLSAENIAAFKREMEEADKAANADPLKAERTQFLTLIIKARLKKRLSQADLATLLNMQQPAIARIESGHGNPSLRTLLTIAKALDADLMLEYKQ